MSLKPAEKAVWDEFVYRQFSRAPDAFDRLGLTGEFDQDWDEAIEDLERVRGSLDPALKSQLRDPAKRDRRLQNVMVKARSNSGEDMLKVLCQRGIMVAFIEAQNKSFVIGDHPQIRMGATGHLGDHQTEFWMPIAPNVAVSPWGNVGAVDRHIMKPDDVRRLNTEIFKNSNLIAGRSPQLVRSLAGL
ncbi:DUF4238 domain-containing protein [Roseibium sp.]|uniref:DUF4238 domain-containing protein n=1 Tax=Roseibium sp. TaxID=1936156 RepID=UPI002624D511|nr:DUF4238 domain-containing protein [Roseibium sp.]